MSTESQRLSDEEILELISKCTELNDTSQWMNDSVLDEALALVVKLTMKPDVPAKHAAPLIVQLQAMSVRFKMQAKNLMVWDKDARQAAQRKNTYMSMSESLDRLVDALKYVVKNF